MTGYFSRNVTLLILSSFVLVAFAPVASARRYSSHRRTPVYIPPVDTRAADAARREVEASRVGRVQAQNRCALLAPS